MHSDPDACFTHQKFHDNCVATKRSQVKYELADFNTIQTGRMNALISNRIQG